MKIEDVINKEILEKLPVLYRTLTIREKNKDVTNPQKIKYFTMAQPFYKATILPFNFNSNE